MTAVTTSLRDIELTRTEHLRDALFAVRNQPEFLDMPKLVRDLVEKALSCQRCFAPMNGEEALVDGQYWCHPCADAHNAEPFEDWLQRTKERLETMKVSILEFDDPGASDDEPVKGVTMGDIRAWHDSYAELEHDSHRDYQALEAELGRLSGAIREARKLVWSHPVEAEKILAGVEEKKLT